MGTVTIPFTIAGNYSGNKYDFFDGTVAVQEDNTYLRNHWRFNEDPVSTSALAIKDWCSTDATYNHGTAYGDVCTATGKYDKALFFNNNSNYLNRVEIPDITSFPNSGDFTFFAWIQRTDLTASSINVIASQSESGNESWVFYQYNDKIYFGSYNGGSYHYYSVSLSEDTNWHLVGFWLNTDTPELEIYVDGSTHTFATIYEPDTATKPFTIGNHPNHYGDTTRRNFRGRIDNPKIYNGQLSSSDTTGLYSASDQFYKTVNSSSNQRVHNTHNFLTETVGIYSGFAVAKGPLNSGTAKYSLSTDGTDYYYYDKGHAGTISGTPIWGTGKLNGAVGTSSSTTISLGQAMDYISATQAFSVSMWFKMSSSNTNSSLFSKRNDVSNYEGLEIFFQSGNLYCTLEDSAGKRIGIYKAISVNNDIWHHIVCTYDGSNSASGMKIYCDGTLLSTTVYKDETLGSTVNPSDPCRIGSYGDTPGRTTVGYFDEIAIFNTVLNSTAVTAIYNSGNGLNLENSSYNTYTNYWKANDGSGYTLADEISGWKKSTDNTDNAQASLESDIDDNILDFETNDSDELYINCFLISDGNQLPQIDSIALDYATAVTSNKGIEFKAMLKNTVNKGIQFNMLPFNDTVKKGIDFNIAPYTGNRYAGIEFNVAPYTEFIHKGIQFNMAKSELIDSRGLQLSVIDYPVLDNRGLEFNLACYNVVDNRGIQLNTLLYTSVNKGLQFNIAGNDTTVNRGVEFTVAKSNGQVNKGIQFNLEQNEVPVWTDRGIQFNIGTKESVYEHKGLSFRVKALLKKAFGIQFTGAMKGDVNKGLSFKVVGLTNKSIMFKVKVGWKYIDRLKTEVIDWIKIKQ